MNYVKINGIVFDAKVAVSEYEQNFNVLDGPNAGRVMTGRMVRDVIGTYVGHKITFFRKANNYAGLDELWDYLVQHSIDDSVMVELADGQTVLSYKAYYTSGTRKLKEINDGTNYWDEFSINFIPIDATYRR